MDSTPHYANLKEINATSRKVAGSSQDDVFFLTDLILPAAL
jgi:hypothetical protein